MKQGDALTKSGNEYENTSKKGVLSNQTQRTFFRY